MSNEDVKKEIMGMLSIIDDTWILFEILRFIKNITK